MFFSVVLAFIFAPSVTCHHVEIVPVQSLPSKDTRVISGGGRHINVRETPLVDERHVVGAYVNVTEGQIVLNVNLDSVAFLYEGHLVRTARILDPLRSGSFLIGPLNKNEADRLAAAINDSVPPCTKGEK